MTKRWDEKVRDRAHPTFPQREVWQRTKERVPEFANDPLLGLSSPRSRLAVVATTLVLLVPAAAIVWAAFRAVDRRIPSATTSVSPSVSASAPETPSPAPKASVDRVIPIEAEGSITTAVVGFGSSWVAGYDRSENPHLTRLDERTGRVLAVIDIPAGPTWETGGGGLAVGDGSVWAVGRYRGHAVVVRIDPSTNGVRATIDIRGRSGADVVVDPTGVWTLSFGVDGMDPMVVSKVDPSTNTVAATIPLSDSYGHFIFSVGGHIVAVTNRTEADVVGDAVLNIIDPSKATLLRSINLGSYAWPAAGDVGTGLWASVAGAVRELDPATGKVVSSWPARGTGDALAVGHGGVWYIDVQDRRWIARLNPADGSTDVRVRLPEGSTPIALATGESELWVVDYDGSVTRIDLT
jgi:hypothetical protein